MYPPPAKPASPVRFLSAACLATLAMLVAFLWCAYASFQSFTATADRTQRMQELRGTIVHLDEVLTMSARMGALTGDPAWEARYREAEPKLEAALKEAMASAVGAQTTRETDEANAALVAMENLAFDLVRQGKAEQARQLLMGPQYAATKAIYSQGMTQLGRQLAQATTDAVHAERRRITFQLIGGVVVICLLLAGWPIMVRLANRGFNASLELRRVQADLNVAREIQRGLLPGEPPDTPGFEVHGWSKPADQTGGDYFDWIKLPGGGTLITLADVSGHGIGPALIVAVCRAYMRAAAGDDGVALGAAISRVNDLLQIDIPADRFVTAAVALLRPQQHELSLVSAGQAPLFFYSAQHKSVESWVADDIPLGVAPGVAFDTPRTVRFEPGDALVMATDGFFEWANSRGEQFGIDRLADFVARNAHRDPDRFVHGLHDAVIAHAGGRPQPDDLTVVIIRRKAAVAPEHAGTGAGSPAASARR